MTGLHERLDYGRQDHGRQEPGYQDPGRQDHGCRASGYQGPRYQAPGYQAPGRQGPAYQDPGRQDHGGRAPGGQDAELPIVAAYMVSRGRVAATPYNRTATVYGRPADLAAVYGLDPAHLRVLDIVNTQPSAVAEIAARMNVPVVALRVLLDELVGRRLVAVTGPDGPPPTPAVLVRALSGLRTM